MAKKKNEELSYQEALQQLQEIVEALEKSDLPVDEVITMVKQANGLLEFCRKSIQNSADTLNGLTSAT